MTVHATPEALEDAVRADPGVLTERGSDGGLVNRLVLAITSDVSLPLRRQPRYLPVLRRALALGADPGVTDGRGWTALHSAAMCGDAELCRILVEGGASTTVAGAGGEVPVLLALFYGQTDAANEVRLVPPSLREAAGLGDLEGIEACLGPGGLSEQATLRLDFVRPILQFPGWDRTRSRAEVVGEALTWAARNGQVGALVRLVAAGADVNANPYRGTAVLWATYGARHEALRWLVAHGADPSLPHDFGGSEHGHGATALHLAAQHGDLPTVELLLELGADGSVRDRSWDATPRGWAEHCGQSGVAGWLAARGAQ